MCPESPLTPKQGCVSCWLQRHANILITLPLCAAPGNTGPGRGQAVVAWANPWHWQGHQACLGSGNEGIDAVAVAALIAWLSGVKLTFAISF